MSGRNKLEADRERTRHGEPRECMCLCVCVTFDYCQTVAKLNTLFVRRSHKQSAGNSFDETIEVKGKMWRQREMPFLRCIIIFVRPYRVKSTYIALERAQCRALSPNFHTRISINSILTSICIFQSNFSYPMRRVRRKFRFSWLNHNQGPKPPKEILCKNRCACDRQRR